MADNNSLPGPILNPNTPLAYLPPTIADQFQVSAYFQVAGLSVAICDWLISLPDEYAMLHESRLSIPVVAYFLSRVGTVGYCACSTLFQIAQVSQCQTLIHILGVFLILSETATTLLFFIRVRAVYENSCIVTLFFGILWTANLGASLLIPFGMKTEHIGTSQQCMTISVQWFAIFPITFNFTFNTLVFLATALQIMSFAIIGSTWHARVKCFFTGDGLPRLSRGLLKGGQVYYSVVVVFSIVLFSMLFSQGVPPLYRAVLAVPTCAIANSMACRVFRDIRLENARAHDNEQHEINTLFQLEEHIPALPPLAAVDGQNRRMSVEMYTARLDTSFVHSK